MRTRLGLILLAIALTGCASQADKDLEAVKSARSVLAEWALVERQGADGRAPGRYVMQMRKLARDRLATAKSALAHREDAVRTLDRVTQGQPDPAALMRARTALGALESGLESS